MLNIRVIGWSANTEQTIDELLQAPTWEAAVGRALEKYSGELQFVIALDESQAPTDSGFSPIGRWENVPLKPDTWRKVGAGRNRFSIMGFDHSQLIPVLEYWEAAAWTMAAQKSLHQHRHHQYRFIAAFNGYLKDSAILGYFTPELKEVLSPPPLLAIQRSAE